MVCARAALLNQWQGARLDVLFCSLDGAVFWLVLTLFRRPGDEAHVSEITHWK